MPEQDMAGAADDDAWMGAGAGELERELTARQAQMDASRTAGSGAKITGNTSSGEPGQGEARRGRRSTHSGWLTNARWGCLHALARPCSRSNKHQQSLASLRGVARLWMCLIPFIPSPSA